MASLTGAGDTASDNVANSGEKATSENVAEFEEKVVRVSITIKTIDRLKPKLRGSNRAPKRSKPTQENNEHLSRYLASLGF